MLLPLLPDASKDCWNEFSSKKYSAPGDAAKRLNTDLHLRILPPTEWIMFSSLPNIPNHAIFGEEDSATKVPLERVTENNGHCVDLEP